MRTDTSLVGRPAAKTFLLRWLFSKNQSCWDINVLAVLIASINKHVYKPAGLETRPPAGDLLSYKPALLPAALLRLWEWKINFAAHWNQTVVLDRAEMTTGDWKLSWFCKTSTRRGSSSHTWTSELSGHSVQVLRGWTVGLKLNLASCTRSKSEILIDISANHWNSSWNWRQLGNSDEHLCQR